MSQNQGFVFTDEQQAFAEVIRDFAASECGTRDQRAALTRDFREAHNQDLYEKIAGFGWAGVSIPEEYGGSGGGVVEQCIFLHELRRGLLPVVGSGSAHVVANCYKRFGTEEQKQRILRAVAEGVVLSISVSEPEAGSDAGNISCRAVPVDGGFVINGQKTWCSFAQYARYILLVARTSREDNRHDGLTMLEIPTDLEGLEIRPIETLGGPELNNVFFTDAFVPDTAVVGEAGRAWPQLMSGLNTERVAASAECIGMAERTMSDLLGYVKERKQFGKPIGSFQALRHRIADLAIELECSRLMTYDMAAKVDAGLDVGTRLTALTSMTKVKVTETTKRIALEGMQMMGGYGYASEYEMERHVRRALSPTIYAGANEVHREIISRDLGLR